MHRTNATVCFDNTEVGSANGKKKKNGKSKSASLFFFFFFFCKSWNREQQKKIQEAWASRWIYVCVRKIKTKMKIKKISIKSGLSSLDWSRKKHPRRTRLWMCTWLCVSLCVFATPLLRLCFQHIYNADNYWEQTQEWRGGRRAEQNPHWNSIETSSSAEWQK